tara:strand:+ start:853 stop:1245 length:393 start_codon:yes stop_codon:yes gene_type:complete
MTGSDQMKAISFVYSGFYYLYSDSGLSHKPDFSAWASCTLAAVFYAFTLLLVIGRIVDAELGEGNFPFGLLAIASGIGIAWLSDWKIQHTWFGARKIEMSVRTRNLAKVVSLGLMLGSWLCFLGVGIAIY